MEVVDKRNRVGGRNRHELTDSVKQVVRGIIIFNIGLVTGF